MSGQAHLRTGDGASEPSPLVSIGGSLQVEAPEQVLEAVTGSHIEAWQLAPGRFQGRLARAPLGRITLDSGQYSLPVGCQGCMSPTDITIGMALNECSWGDFNGLPLADAGCEVYGANSEFTANGPAGTLWASIVVSPEAIERTALVTGRDPNIPAHGDVLLIPGADPAVQLLRQHVSEMVALTCHPSATMSLGAAETLAGLLDDELVLLTTLMLSRQPAKERPTFQRRVRIVETARRFMEDNRGRTVTLPELCLVTASSERALQHAFREVTGVSPSTYLRMRALHGARRALREPDATTTVTAVAMSWGFWHLGRFAEHYRRLFGERPSETLRATPAE